MAGTREAWGELFERLRGPIFAVVYRSAQMWGAPAPDLVEDLVQDTFVRLCANDYRILREFELRTPSAILALARLVAASVATDHFKMRNRLKRRGQQQSLADELYQDELNDVQAMERGLLLQQIDRFMRQSLGRVSQRDYEVFWLYYRQGLTASAIASIPAVGLSVKGVESTIGRLRNQLRRRMSGARAGE